MRRFSGALVIAAVSVLMGSVLFGLFLAFLRPHTPWPVPVTVSHPDLARIESLTHLRFPKGTTVVASRMEQAQDSYFIAKLTIPKHAVAGFIDQLRKSGEISHSDRLSMDILSDSGRDVPGWWDAQTVRSFTSIRILYGKPYDLNSTDILVPAKSNILYIFWSGL